MVVADRHEAVPLGMVFDLPIQFGTTTIPSTAIVVDTDTYDVVLGNDWLDHVGAVIDIRRRKLTIEWKSREIEIPLNLEKGIKQKEFMVTQFRGTPIRRGPTSEEKMHLINRIMFDQHCNLCDARVYCAEMMCTCPDTWIFEYGLSWEQAYPKGRKKRQPSPEPEKYYPPLWFGKQARGPWNGSNPHPFRNGPRNRSGYDKLNSCWEIFWKNVKYISKKHFIEKRSKYEAKIEGAPAYYWSEVNITDLATILARSEEGWVYQDNWREDEGWYPSNKLPESAFHVVQFKQDENATAPRREEGNAGIDLASTENIEIPPWERWTVGTGLRFKIPEGYYRQLYPRSSLTLKGLNTEGGVIDPSYRGEIKMILSNRDPRETLQIYAGDYIVQMVIHKIHEGKLQQVQELDQTNRGSKGFGSTGAHAVVIKKNVNELEHKQQKTEKHGYKIGVLPSEEQKQILINLFKQMEDVFAVNFEEIRAKEPQYYHDIDTGDHPPIKMKPYRVPPAYKKWQEEENKRLEETGIIKKSISPWGAPCVLVPKKGAEQGSYALRQCHDYIKLNAITKKNAYPLPLIDDILDLLRPSAKWLSVLDMFSGFFQIGLTPRAQERTSFVTAHEQYEYLRMPFGLCNAPASFQRMMNEVFKDMIGTNLLVYIDDVTIYTDTFEEHLAALHQVFTRLREKGLFVKPSKCTFATDSIQLLGFVIDQKGIRTDPEKMSAVAKFPRPMDRTTMRAFLGLANYYRRFIKDYVEMARPLNNLLTIDQEFE